MFVDDLYIHVNNLKSNTLWKTRKADWVSVWYKFNKVRVFMKRAVPIPKRITCVLRKTGYSFYLKFTCSKDFYELLIKYYIYIMEILF